MVNGVSQHSNLIQASSQVTSTDLKEETYLKPNTLKNRLMSGYQKTTSAFIEYPVKGLTGSKRSNFYEFLSMGTVPYLVGSAAFMGIFNGVSHLFADNAAIKAAKTSGWGNRMALGVVLYGLAKNLSKSLISTPVKLATGIDTEMAYEKHIYSDPKLNLKHPIHEYEQHKVMESHDFPRYDMMYGEKLSKDKDHPLPHNYLFDKIAKKNGLGENLPASDTEVKPLIKDVISRSNTAKSISSYLWAAVGVMLAVQKPWNNFFRAASKASWHSFAPKADAGLIKNIAGRAVNTAKNVGRISMSFGRNLVESAKELYKGPAGEKGFTKHAGKIMLGIAAASSILGAINTIYGAKTAAGQKNRNVFDKKDKITVQ
ncbi:MAG: hypothetical protein K6E29_00435 [Cyanobacteria bacterium RUI128]|nr:hypothetical protein [Cyanobacteria bacterium RUI128]